ncbi:hypothetical protein P3102_18875 [Amycolatopsis sp. QT-25]|uniref:hypothetical protein n=1 Tax=Amycolatopsis sp. QT-25 TaxID=3034022 RepID=UPI0023EB712B|nr:hypothetical protein [Amycolatopsis sp. QT-25]WET76203.1 hypothetical protein P3102_18875 [Amycolatopsis sp. QT-25]
MKIRKSRIERLPRSIEKRLRDLQKREAPDIATAQLKKDIDRRLAALGEGADPAASIKNYVSAHKAEWTLKVKDEHNRRLTEIGGLATEAHALVEYRRILCEDQRDVLDDLDSAVAHALERVTDPDAPYHEPIRRSERRGGKK